MLPRIAYLLTGDHHAAEELVQTVLIKIAPDLAAVSTVSQPVAYVRPTTRGAMTALPRTVITQRGEST